VLSSLASKKEIRDKENQERLANAINTLDSIARNNNIQKNIRNIVREILTGIKDEKNGSISVRAADAITHTNAAVASRFDPGEHKRIETGYSNQEESTFLACFN